MEDIISFLLDLKENNNKEWFNSQKKRYDQARGQFISIVEQIILQMQSFEPDMAALTPQQCIFRINRDVRFALDKSPYKINFAAVFNPDGKKSPKAGYYFHIEPKQSFVGGGIYMPSSEVLKGIRQEIDYNFEEFKEIIDHKKFKTLYPSTYEEGKLSRPPKDYSSENPAIEFLKLKHFIYSHELSDDQFKDSKDVVKTTVKAFEALKPYNDFLNRSLEK